MHTTSRKLPNNRHRSLSLLVLAGLLAISLAAAHSADASEPPAPFVKNVESHYAAPAVFGFCKGFGVGACTPTAGAFSMTTYVVTQADVYQYHLVALDFIGLGNSFDCDTIIGAPYQAYGSIDLGIVDPDTGYCHYAVAELQTLLGQPTVTVEIQGSSREHFIRIHVANLPLVQVA